MRSHLGKLALVTGATLAVVLAAEVTLRATHLFGARVSWTQPDELIGWRFTPGRSYWHFKENDHPVSGRINSHGWRDRERALRKPEGAARVAVLGDSFVEAFQVEADSTFCAIAERSLARRLNAPAEVLNFGRSGMTVTEELLILEREVLSYEPDVVVVVFAPYNDIADLHPHTALEPMRPFFRPLPDGSLELDTGFRATRRFRLRRALNGLKQRSALVSLLAARYNVMRQARRQRKETRDAQSRGGIGGYLSLCTDTPDARYAESYRLYKRLLEEVGTACRRAGSELLVVAVHTVYRSAEIDNLRALDESFEPGAIDADMARWCAQRGYAFLGLQPHFRRLHESGGPDLTWSHFNYHGHRVVAEQLTERLLEILEPGA